MNTASLKQHPGSVMRAAVLPIGYLYMAMVNIRIPTEKHSRLPLVSDIWFN
jgi:hypothetical protein